MMRSKRSWRSSRSVSRHKGELGKQSADPSFLLVEGIKERNHVDESVCHLQDSSFQVSLGREGAVPVWVGMGWLEAQERGSSPIQTAPARYPLTRLTSAALGWRAHVRLRRDSDRQSCRKSDRSCQPQSWPGTRILRSLHRALPWPIESWSLWTITIRDRHCKLFSVWKGTTSRSWETALRL